MVLPSGKALCIGLFVALAGAATAQQSTSYKLEESHFNAGGTPIGGNSASSPSFLISMDSLGDGVGGGSIASASFSIDSGFGAAYAPPGEVDGLRFSDKTTLEWNPEYTLGVYNLYRDLISNLTGLGFGNCQQQDLTSPGTSDGDASNSRIGSPRSQS